MNDAFNQIANDVVFALAWTLIHSVWQFAIVALCFLGLSPFIKTSSLRYQLALSSLFICALLSMVTFYHYYSSIFDVRQIFTAAMLQANHQETNDLLSSAILFFNKHLYVIMSAWLVGFFIHLCRTTFDYIACKKLITFQSNNLDAAWENKFLALQGVIGLGHKITYKLSSLVNSPCVVGVFKPVILIPPALLLHLPIAQVEAVILHELAHIKRNDYLINLVQCIIRGIFFFNPFLLYLSRTIDQERENTCDDIAVYYCGNAMEYSKGISTLAELNSSNQLALAAKSKKYSILPRIRRLFGDHSSEKNTTFQLFCSAVIGVFGLVMAANIQALPNNPVHINPTQINSVPTNQAPINQKPINQKPINQKPINPSSTTPSSIHVAPSNPGESSVAKAPATTKPEEIYAAPIAEKLPAASTELRRQEPSSVVATAAIDYVKTTNDKASSDDLKTAAQSKPKKSGATPIDSPTETAQTPADIKSEAPDSVNASKQQPSNSQHGSNAPHFSKWEKSMLLKFFISGDVDFSKYDGVIVFPTTFDRLSISEKTKPRVAKAWMRSSFKEMDKLCLYFDQAAKQQFKESNSFTLADKGGDNVLAIEIRMKEIFPLSASKEFPRIGSLVLQAVMVESKTGKLVAVVEENMAFGTFRYAGDAYSGSGGSITLLPGSRIPSVWEGISTIFAKKLHDDMNKLKHSNFN